MSEKASKRGRSQSVSSRYDIHWRGQVSDYVTALAWSGDGEFLAIASASGEVALWSEAGRVVLRSPDDGQSIEQSINCVGFSADGTYLAASGQQGAVFIWRRDRLTQPPTVLKDAHCWVDQLAWHPTRPWLVFGVNSRVNVWDVAQAQLLTEQDFGASSVLGLAWHPGGELLAVSGHTGVKVWNVADWAAAPERMEMPGASLSVAWSADGAYLASGNLDKTLTVARWGEPPPWLMQGFPGKVRRVSWQSGVNLAGGGDGEPVVAAACMEGVTVWRRRGQNWKSSVLEGHVGTVSAIAFHPDQPLLASAADDGLVCIWKDARSLSTVLKELKGGVGALAWHPKGQQLAAGSSQGEVLIWKASRRGTGFKKR
ncbi:MAG: WD40 repeat domain-containing protein [Cyanobacteria bacterium J06623_4]